MALLTVAALLVKPERKVLIPIFTSDERNRRIYATENQVFLFGRTIPLARTTLVAEPIL
jgi:hypothetical protein